MKVRLRIAPSPSGEPHLGTAYIALFNFVFARHHRGELVLRSEDTDRQRSQRAYEAAIFRALRWCGIEWDEGPDVGGPFAPYRQSERLPIYRRYCQQLLESGAAYKCFATADQLQQMRQQAAQRGAPPRYDRRDRNLSPEEVAARGDQPYVIRLKAPLSGECVYEDGVKGSIRHPWADVDDQILLKSDGTPTYHLASVVDDHLMQISHVIRGDEWLSSTPKHLLLYHHLRWSPPLFFHLPLLLGSDGKKLSKRKSPTSIFYYRDSGYLPEALLNFLSLMGYSMADGQEIYSIGQLIARFDPRRIGTSKAFFDPRKLDWLNQQYLIRLPQQTLWPRIKEWGLSDAFMEQLMPLCQTRMKTLGQFMELAHFFFVNQLPYRRELFTVGNAGPEEAKVLLQAMLLALEPLVDWQAAAVQAASQQVATAAAVHYKKVLIPILFAALIGSHRGLPLFRSMELLGRARSRARLLQAIEHLGALSSRQRAAIEAAWQQRDLQAFFPPPDRS